MTAKLRTPVRDQMQLRHESLDQLLPPDHPARAAWAFACGLDLTPWTQRIRSRRGAGGAPAIDPRTLLALWLFATLDGVGSARAIARLCTDHLAYRWLCGDDPVNAHTLADFRTSDPDALDGLLAQSAASLMHQGLADLSRIAQDGVKVRASAGAASFRREPTLRECLAAAEKQVAALKATDDPGDEGAGDDSGLSPGVRAARARAADGRRARVAAALENLDELRAINADRRTDKKKDPAELRVSTTDPEARRMKLADGGFRPAYNVQFATTTAGGVVVGVGVTQEGCDNNQLVPMLEQLETAYRKTPTAALVDGGYVDRESIEAAEKVHAVKVHAPVKDAAKDRAKGKDPFARRAGDTDGVADWRARMGTGAAQAVYKLRGQTAEWVNALARNRGLRQFVVRGLAKVRSSSLLFALAHNLAQGVRLRAVAAAV
jgi:transposase